jgi:ABC-type Fe3+/spermidine/putrescine transport system ATPase subunit
MPRIELRNIHKHVLDGLTLIIEDGEIVALVGPNGAGKSTVLNVIAGLTPYKGEVYFDGKKMDDIPSYRRGVGYLFQDLCLFPHLTVGANIAYSLRVRGDNGAAIAARVKELTKALHIEKLKERYPQSLSGGEKQRVAIARAVACSPKILLLDEPTSSLDSQTAKYLRAELGGFLRRMGITAVFVVHDLLGAEEIADRIAIIHKGRIEQTGPPEIIFFDPGTEVVSEFIGRPNILVCDRCRVLSSGLVEIVSGDVRVVFPYEGNMVERIAISPHDIYVSRTKPPGPTLNRYQAIVTNISRHRSQVRIGLRIGRTIIAAELTDSAFDEMDIAEGSEVYIVIKLRRLRYVESKAKRHLWPESASEN